MSYIVIYHFPTKLSFSSQELANEMFIFIPTYLILAANPFNQTEVWALLSANDLQFISLKYGM